jgi:hypothetical protein
MVSQSSIDAGIFPDHFHGPVNRTRHNAPVNRPNPDGGGVTNGHAAADCDGGRP